MEYKRNIYLFLIFDFLTNLSPLSFIYALFLKQQNISLTQIGFIISVYQISKLIFEIPSGINVNLKMYSFDHLRMYNIDHINTCCSRR